MDLGACLRVRVTTALPDRQIKGRGGLRRAVHFTHDGGSEELHLEGPH